MATVPKLKQDLERRNVPEHDTTQLAYGDPQDELPFPVDLNPQPPEYDPTAGGKDEWHPIAREMWGALKRDPSSMWTSSAGWALNLAMCEQLSRLLSPRVVGVIQPTEHFEGGPIREDAPMSGAEMNAIMSWAGKVGMLEADRRRLHYEITFRRKQRYDTAEQATDEAPKLAVVLDREALFQGASGE